MISNSPPNNVIQSTSARKVRKNSVAVMTFGILHIILGSITFIFGVVVAGRLGYSGSLGQSTAAWCSFVFIATGILGAIIKCKPHNKSLVVSHGVFAILTILFAIAIFIAGAIGTHYHTCGETEYRGFYELSLYCRYTIFLIAIGILEMIFAIISTIFAVRLINCGNGCCNEGSGAQSGDPQIYFTQPYQLARQNAVFHPEHIPIQPIVQPLQYQSETLQTTDQPLTLTNPDGQQFYLVPVSKSSQMASASVTSTQVENTPIYQQ